MHQPKLTSHQHPLMSIPFLAIDPQEGLLHDPDLMTEEAEALSLEENIPPRKCLRLKKTSSGNNMLTGIYTDSSDELTKENLLLTLPKQQKQAQSLSPFNDSFVLPAAESFSVSLDELETNCPSPEQLSTTPPALSFLKDVEQLYPFLKKKRSSQAALTPSKQGIDSFEKRFNFQKKAENARDENPHNHFKKQKGAQIEIRTFNNHRPIPVINSTVCGSRLINDTPSLLDYCLKWCKTIFPNQIIFRAVHNTGTLLMIIPGGRLYFIQFIYGKETQNDFQKAFQCQIAPQPLFIFRSFQAFSAFMKDKNLKNV